MRAITPAMRKYPNDVTKYMYPMVLWFVVVK
jgi:hypothetical protein